MSFSADSALEYLQRAHKKNRLAHAYLISGPAGSGKSDVAARLAAALNKTTPEKVLRAQAPDVFVTEPASRSRKIVVGQIRRLERVLQLRTAGNRKKIGIIRDADRMQTQAANAFLKTLEEPPQNSLLLLLTALPEALPEPAPANRARDRAFAAGNGVVALVMRDGGGKIARDRRGVSGFARNPGPAQFHSRADQGRTRGGLETRGNALPSYH